MRLAYKAAGPDAVAGFRTVLDYIVDPNGTEDENQNGLDSELLE
jgi:hypothetical protein